MLVCSIIHGVQFFTFLTAGERRKGISGRERRKRWGLSRMRVFRSTVECTRALTSHSWLNHPF